MAKNIFYLVLEAGFFLFFFVFLDQWLLPLRALFSPPLCHRFYRARESFLNYYEFDGVCGGGPKRGKKKNVDEMIW